VSAEQNVRTLIERGFVSTAFQPIVNLNTGRVVGYEALLRGPAGTILAKPGVVFGPQTALPEEAITELDVACVAAALRGGRLLVPFGLLFINLHISTLLRMNKLEDHFQRLMESSRIPPEAVVIEISERSTTAAPRAMSRILRAARKRGYRFALDDFGTAWSGLQHLLWFEPEYVKMDRAFVQGIDRSARKQALVSQIGALTKRLGSEVIAEGVETNAELLTLMALDVPLAQGFHFGHPRGALYWTADRETRANYKQYFSSSVPLHTSTLEGGKRVQSLPLPSRRTEART
jgi:EAL domain-containing protein (putative c-di-GMP-specific phosphodiesterase class I)